MNDINIRATIKKQKTITNEDLLQRALQFDADALCLLHQRNFESIYRYILLKVRDPHFAEDLTSEVFLRVLEALKKGRGWTNAPEAWIFGIAHNVVVDFYRGKSQEQMQELDEEVDAMALEDSFRYILQSDRRIDILRAMQRLTPEQRDVAVLRFIEGLSLADTAQILVKTIGATKALQYRALQALAELLYEHQVAIER